MVGETAGQGEPLRGLVAAILSERELVINVGSDDGVKVSMKFKVLAATPLEVKDPETGDVLGVLDREKVRVTVTEVNSKLSVCRTYRRRYAGGGPLHGFAALQRSLLSESLYAEPREVDETLKIEDSVLPAPLSEEESYVKRGDRVVQVIKEAD